MSEPHVLPLLLCRGRLGRKGSLPVKARKADSVGLHLRPFFVRNHLGWFNLYFFFGAADNVLVYTILLIISVRRPVFNQLVGTGYLIIKRLAFIDLSYRSLSDEFF